MTGWITESEQIDHRTYRSICDAVGEQLQQSMRPDSSHLSMQLQRLIDELRRSERAPNDSFKPPR